MFGFGSIQAAQRRGRELDRELEAFEAEVRAHNAGVDARAAARNAEMLVKRLREWRAAYFDAEIDRTAFAAVLRTVNKAYLTGISIDNDGDRAALLEKSLSPSPARRKIFVDAARNRAGELARDFPDFADEIRKIAEDGLLKAQFIAVANGPAI